MAVPIAHAGRLRHGFQARLSPPGGCWAARDSRLEGTRCDIRDHSHPPGVNWPPIETYDPRYPVTVRGLNVISSSDFLYADSPTFRICALPSLNRYTFAIGSGTRCTSELAGLAGCRKLV